MQSGSVLPRTRARSLAATLRACALQPGSSRPVTQREIAGTILEARLAVLGQADRVEGAAWVLALLGVRLAVALRLRERQHGDRLRGRGATLRRLCALRALAYRFSV